ncbi:MAG: hypothetical protein ACI9EF_001406 [Pseudohongiellaceae bacterium]|jgi:hypothetical protein
MARRTALQGTLNSFLGRYTSRHSDYRSYWLLGQLPALDLSNGSFDLLNLAVEATSPTGAAQNLAARRFAEQVAEAELRITTTSSSRWSPLAETWLSANPRTGAKVLKCDCSKATINLELPG